MSVAGGERERDGETVVGGGLLAHGGWSGGVGPRLGEDGEGGGLKEDMVVGRGGGLRVWCC